jgi:hypothetical protein
MFFHNRWCWWLNMKREALQPWFSVFATHQSLQGGRSAVPQWSIGPCRPVTGVTGALVKNQGIVLGLTELRRPH